MGKRNSGPMFALISMIAASVASFVAVAATPDMADACSIAAPYAEASPTSGLAPGQQVKVAGWAFYDIGFTDAPAAVSQTAGDDDPFDSAVPPELCDFDLFPTSEIVVTWSGNVHEKLAVVNGPEFTLAVTVPLGARPGPATIMVGDVPVSVSVGPDIEPPPPPCPLVADHAALARHECPEPWPCPSLSANDRGTQPAPGPLLPCPDPCVDYAHTTTDGTVYDYRWDCPHPCTGSQASPGAPANTAVWCPEPEPCPLYTASDAEAYFAPQWCPDPCGLVGGDAVWCPDPCGLVGGDAVWCPEPCGLVGGDAVWCPEPCPVYLADEALGERAIYCPDPCRHGFDHNGLATAQGVWCPPERLALVSPPAPAPPSVAAAPTETATPAQATAVVPALQEMTEAGQHVVDVYATAGSITRQLMHSLRTMLSSLFS